MSRCSRLTLAIAMAGATLLFASAALTAAPRPPTQLAKAPQSGTGVSPVAKSGTGVSPVTSPAKPFKLAQLDYPVPPTASAADLLQVADDFASQGDFVSVRSALEQLVSARPGTKEAGFALGLLADEYASIGDATRADACAAQLAAYSDSEVQAYAAMCRTAYPAQRASQWTLYEQTLTAYIEQWKGAPSAARAGLSLGDYCRFNRPDYPRAIAVFRGLAADYAGTLAGEEALVALAETLNWSVPAHHEEAQAAFEQALNTVHYPGLQVRCVVGLADLLTKSSAPDQAADALSQLISAYPSHPSVGHAYALRSYAAETLGNWDQCVSDARAFLAKPVLGSYAVARCHLVLGKDAYRKGHLEDAAAEFTATSQLAEADNHAFETSDLGGPAQAGLAALAADRGDLRGAMQAYLKAADLVTNSGRKALYLSFAVSAADRLGDSEARSAIITRMIAEAPGSSFTTNLVGHELLPAPEI